MKSTRPVYLLVFLSGFAGLVYQVLWMRQLGLLFGNTSHAAAATFAAFFSGLAIGSWFWGERSVRSRNALRTYARLEAGIAVTAILYFVVLLIFYRVYPLVYSGVSSAGVLLAVKFGLALLLVFPPSFCMGGTIPAMGQFVIRRKASFGTTAAMLYGVNVLGAALGALMAGFVFAAVFGFRLTCIGNIVLTTVIAATAFRMSRAGYAHGRADAKTSPPVKKGDAGPRARIALRSMCFLSGFSVLALEVLWTRMFAQIHENSVYSFSAVLTLVLTSLALGSLVSSRLAMLRRPPERTLAMLSVAGGIAVSVSPFVLMHLTNGLDMIPTAGSFLSYMLELLGKGVLVAGIPALILGTVFPFLMKTEERFAGQPGSRIGRLSAVNTAGAILGSVLCGFVMLEYLGMWRTLQIIAALYLLAGVLLPVMLRTSSRISSCTGILFLILLFTVMSPAGLPVTGRDPARRQERLVEVWEDSDCNVSVTVDEMGHRAMQINSNYRLGSTGAAADQVGQARIPLFVYPDTKSIFFLGLGTGMSAGAALDKHFTSVERVVACELVPGVIAAARKYMAGDPGTAGGFDYTGGLFTDERVEMLAEDGRHYLMATDETFDMVNADLFLPYRSGAGSLYSREHFESVKKSLNPGGVFVQWLPLFQMTEFEFGVIARTMLEVFDQVTFWRNNFAPGGEVFALMGHVDGSPLPPTTVDTGEANRESIRGMGYRDIARVPLMIHEQTVLLFYCGNISASRELFAEYPVNTDDRPIIEYSVPRTLRRFNENMKVPHTLVGPNLTALVDKVMSKCPPSGDPMLVRRNERDRHLPLAGAAYHRAFLASAMGETSEWRDGWNTFVRELTAASGD